MKTETQVPHLPLCSQGSFLRWEETLHEQLLKE